MKYAFLLLAALALPASAAPVHVSLKASASLGPSANGFLTLAQIADLSGGAKAERVRMASVLVGRLPLPGDTRLLTVGDINLKLRQAGFHPEHDAFLEGAKQVSVTSAQTQASSPLALPPPVSPSAPAQVQGSADTKSAPPAASAIVVHRSDTVSVVVQQGDMTITAKATARESGSVGQTIRVHRDGAPSDLAATVVDAQTVQLKP